MNNTVFHFAGDPDADLRVLGTLADVHWILPPLADGTYICSLNRDASGAARTLLASIAGVTILPSRYSSRALEQKHTALMKELLNPAIASHTMHDVLAAVFAKNPHPVFDPDA